MSGVTDFYEQHPITEAQVMAALARDRAGAASARPEDLYAYDQDHYGGLAAVDRLIGRAAIKSGMTVLDVCAGLGGPARYIARRTGARLTGIDLTTSRAIGAARLTRLVGLADAATFVNGDATALPFADGSFNAAIAQEAFLHIADKAALFSELHRVLRPGGRLAFSDWTAAANLDSATRERLASGIAARDIRAPDDYRAAIAQAGFSDVAVEDLSAEWRDILIERLEMFRNMEADTVAQHGEAAHRRYIEAYEFFVARITDGSLGGGLFTARRA
jgi:sarcosine/dimethylglycine N-methyltransferase